DYTNDKIDAAFPAKSPWRIPETFALRMINPENLVACNDGGPCESNPLYESRRTAGFGEVLQLDTVDTNVDDALASADFDNFQFLLEGGVHCVVHCAVGNSCLGPYMGVVPAAANDPLFWLHHANIDRLWDCWSEMHGPTRNPIGDKEWMEKEFFFVDEKGNP